MRKAKYAQSCPTQGTIKRKTTAGITGISWEGLYPEKDARTAVCADDVMPRTIRFGVGLYGLSLPLITEHLNYEPPAAEFANTAESMPHGPTRSPEFPPNPSSQPPQAHNFPNMCGLGFRVAAFNLQPPTLQTKRQPKILEKTLHSTWLLSSQGPKEIGILFFAKKCILANAEPQDSLPPKPYKSGHRPKTTNAEALTYTILYPNLKLKTPTPRAPSQVAHSKRIVPWNMKLPKPTTNLRRSWSRFRGL